MREVALFKLINNGVVDPKYAPEVLKVAEILEEGRINSGEISDPLPAPFDYAKEPPFFVIKGLTRVQNFRQTRMHKIAVEEATYRNGKNADQMVGWGYHGTSEQSAELIAKYGPHTTKTRNGAYGWGVYLGLDNYAIPIVYANRNRGPSAFLSLVMGPTVVGGNSATVSGQDHPNTGDDTGGCGSKWIHVVFDDYDFSPEYIIYVEKKTKEDWIKQLSGFRNDVKQQKGKNRKVSSLSSVLPTSSSPLSFLPAPVVAAPPLSFLPVAAPVVSAPLLSFIPAPVVSAPPLSFPPPVAPVVAAPPLSFIPVAAPVVAAPIAPIPPPIAQILAAASILSSVVPAPPPAAGTPKKRKRRTAPRFTTKKKQTGPAVFKPTPPTSEESSSESETSDPSFKGKK
jgi:hypothetical protein